MYKSIATPCIYPSRIYKSVLRKNVHYTLHTFNSDVYYGTLNKFYGVFCLRIDEIKPYNTLQEICMAAMK